MISHILKKALWVVGLIVLLLVIVILFFNVQRIMRESDVAAETAPKSGKFVNGGDAKIFVQDIGPTTSPVVVLVHGTGTWGEIWRETIDALVLEGYRVVAIDLPPFGYSEKLKGADSYTREKQAARIMKTLDALEINRATFVGHSVGSRPVIEAALISEERFDGLVLVDPAVGFDGDKKSSISYRQNDAPGIIKVLFELAPLRNALISTYGTNPLFIGKLLSTFVSKKEAITKERIKIIVTPMSVEGTTHAYGDWLQNLTVSTDTSQGSDFANFKDLTMPVLLIWGSTDTVTPFWQGETLKTLIPGSELAVIEGSGHIPYIEDVTAFNKLLLKFLAR